MTAYRNTEEGVVTVGSFGTDADAYLDITDLMLVDNAIGISPMSAQPNYLLESTVVLRDSVIVGDVDSSDVCHDKYGIYLPVSALNHGKSHIETDYNLPWRRVEDEPAS